MTFPSDCGKVKLFVICILFIDKIKPEDKMTEKLVLKIFLIFRDFSPKFKIRPSLQPDTF